MLTIGSIIDVNLLVFFVVVVVVPLCSSLDTQFCQEPVVLLIHLKAYLNLRLAKHLFVCMQSRIRYHWYDHIKS